MLRLIVAIVCMAISSTLLTAQNDNKSTTVFYADGSVFNGVIVEEDVSYMHLLLVTGDTIKLHKLLIDKDGHRRNIAQPKKEKYHKKEGLFSSVEYGLGVGSGGGSTMIQGIFGKRIKPNLNVGIGLGYSYSSFNNPGVWQDNTFLNIFGFGRYYLNDKKFRLFTDAKIGYGIKQDDAWASYTSGFYAQPGIGFEIANRKKMKWSIKLSQFIQNTSGSNQWNDQFNNPILFNYNHWYNRTMFTVGINF